MNEKNEILQEVNYTLGRTAFEPGKSLSEQLREERLKIAKEMEPYRDSRTRIDNVLPFRDSKEEDDEKHVHPLQLDVIDRIVELYSNPKEVVLTPFMGVGSEVYSPVSLGRKAIGIELKDSYYKQAILNLKEANNRFEQTIHPELF